MVAHLSEAITPSESLTDPENSASKAGDSFDPLELLLDQPLPLYAVLDAARTPRILEVLQESQLEWSSLYEGAKGEELDIVAPYLIGHFLPQSTLLRLLVEEGWGQSWGIFLTSEEDFPRVRRHLRKFLMVKDGEGRELYFRFYDPRVLRVFIPSCSPEQIREVFGPVDCFQMEAEDPKHLVRFSQLDGTHQKSLFKISDHWLDTIGIVRQRDGDHELPT